MIILIIASSLSCHSTATPPIGVSENEICIPFNDSDGTATCKITVNSVLRGLFDTDEPPTDVAYKAWAAECSSDLRVEFDPPLSEKDGVTLQCYSVMSACLHNHTASSFLIIKPGVISAIKTAGNGDTEIALSFVKHIIYPDDKNPDGTYVYGCGGTSAPCFIWLTEADGDYYVLKSSFGAGGIIIPEQSDS